MSEQDQPEPDEPPRSVGTQYEPIDPDVDIDDPAERADRRPPREYAVLGAMAIGGVIGAEARYGLARAIVHTTGTWPWSTLLINLVGSALIGVLMVMVLEVLTPHPLVRPFLGTGILGGFTTFSTFSLDVQSLLLADRPAIALLYAAVSFVGCFAATSGAIALTRAATTPRRPA